MLIVRAEEVEQWKDAPGFESIIEVSSLGRIRSKRRTISFSDGKPNRIIGGVILSQQIDKCGYARVRVSNQGKKATIKVHRAVAEAFVQNSDAKPQVNHIDGNKANNAAKNLEWATNSENQIHANATLLRKTPRGSDSCRYKGDVLAYDKNGILVATIKSRDDMNRFGFDFRLVSACINGKRKSHKGHSFARAKVEDKESKKEAKK